jgi:hypothetical protein
LEIILILIIFIFVLFSAYYLQKEYWKKNYYKPHHITLKDAKDICENMFNELKVDYTKKNRIGGYYYLPKMNIKIHILKNYMSLVINENTNMNEAINIMNEIDKRIE